MSTPIFPLDCIPYQVAIVDGDISALTVSLTPESDELDLAQELSPECCD